MKRQRRRLKRNVRSAPLALRAKQSRWSRGSTTANEISSRGFATRKSASNKRGDLRHNMNKKASLGRPRYPSNIICGSRSAIAQTFFSYLDIFELGWNVRRATWATRLASSSLQLVRPARCNMHDTCHRHGVTCAALEFIGSSDVTTTSKEQQFRMKKGDKSYRSSGEMYIASYGLCWRALCLWAATGNEFMKPRSSVIRWIPAGITPCSNFTRGQGIPKRGGRRPQSHWEEG